MDNQKAWDIVIGEVEGECRSHAQCSECPFEYPCMSLDEQLFETLKTIKETLYRQD